MTGLSALIIIITTTIIIIINQDVRWVMTFFDCDCVCLSTSSRLWAIPPPKGRNTRSATGTGKGVVWIHFIDI